jgi:hypothetical protein
MKVLYIITTLIISAPLLAQKTAFDKKIIFDSSYCVIGIGQSWSNQTKSFENLSFIINTPEDLALLKKDWVIKKQVPVVQIEKGGFSIFTTKKKLLTQSGVELIFLEQEIIKAQNSWYKFDISKLKKLHDEHPLEYHIQTFSFDTHLQYAFFYDSVIRRPDLLFLLEPSFMYEGRFVISFEVTPELSNPIWALHIVNEELSAKFSKNSFRAYSVVEQSVYKNINRIDIKVESSKDVYNNCKSKLGTKGEWKPALVETTVYFRD